MTKAKAQRSTRPPASSKKLDDAIEQSLKTLDSLATPRLRTNEKWRQGPLVWKVMLEMSREGMVNGRTPSIRKHDLAYELKRRYGSDIEVDHTLWKRYLSFYEQYGSRLREGVVAAGLPALALERVTNNGVGGHPDKTEAVYWLCFDSDSQSEHDKSDLAPEVTENSELAREDKDSARAAKGSTANVEVVTPQSLRTPEVDSSEPQVASTKAAGEDVDVALNSADAVDKIHEAANQSHLLWLATIASRPNRSLATPATLALALALLVPTLGCVATEIISPIQALTDSISSLADVFNGSIGIRT
jgi:hypothetical protein